MAKREIPEIDEAGEILEKVEAAEKLRREAWVKMELARKEFKDAKDQHQQAAEAVFAASGTRLEKLPMFDQDEDDEV